MQIEPLDPCCVDLWKRCDIAVETRSTPPFILQISGYTAAELREKPGDAVTEIVRMALKRRRIPAADLISCGEPMLVRLRGQSGRPR